ncbi:uncharacterized protein [Leptinotarsa decemlineata]|uniref:uncharacterized protein n=1 Tax=Leptinotarsa decemlineata TaxID=7539 RepID=UPI003D30CAEE
MLPATLVTLTTFLLELCSSSPVYNMQPAFITNTIGITTGRNIRNLACVSRKNNNQKGICMFAIDCLKANGTHLGTCIDRFYFGSCCHVEPIRDIIDNSIDTDILPHREPPLRVSSTTPKIRTSTTVASTRTPVTSSNKFNASTTVNSNTSRRTTVRTTSKPVTVSTKQKPTPTPTMIVFGQRVTTTSSTTAATEAETSTAPQKLQTFQAVNGNIVEESTLAPTKVPTVSSIKPITSKPTTHSKPTAVSRPASSKPSGKPTSSTGTTNVKPKPSVKPTGTSSTKKPTRKPAETTTKASKPVVTSKRPQSTSTTKVTKKPAIATPKPTKASTTVKSPTAQKNSTAKPIQTSPTKPTKGTTATPKPSTSIKVSTKSPTKLPGSSTTQVPSKVPISTTKTPVSTTTQSNEVQLEKINSTSNLQTVIGNTSTNEIEQGKPVDEVTNKPGLVTWTIVDDKNQSSSTQLPEVNSTTEGETFLLNAGLLINVWIPKKDWIPITTPDGWVLIPSVSVTTQSDNATQSPTSPPMAASTSSVISSSVTSSPETEMPTASPDDKPFVTFVSIETTTSPLNISTSTSSEDTSFGTEASSSPEPTASPSTATSSTADVTLSTETSEKPSVNMSDYNDVCGRRMFPEARIVGGEKSPFGKWPWQISLRQWRTSTYLHKCGAALLNENWAITAAHCVDNVPPSDLLLRLGEHDLSTESEPYLHQERRVQVVASHPQFDPRTFEYDLALLRFYEPVTFQPNILPVCVPQTDENFVGRTAYVTGWGRLYEDGPLPSILQEVSVPVINNTVCESMYRAAGYIEHIPHIFICAGWRRGGFDSCEGDSGGPMVIQREDKRFLLAGVISWGIGCAEPNQPGVYTRISEFRQWINLILKF